MTAPDIAVAPARPPLWLRLTVPAGNAAQVAGLAVGVALLALDAHLRAPGAARVALMLIAWLAIYICCHASAHYAVGRLLGIRYRAYGLRGTDHPDAYPPGLRQLMSVLPCFTAMTERDSLRRARPWARALMFAAGETSTAVCSILAALYAALSGIPGGGVLLVVMVIFNALSAVATSITPRGDYAKAWRALRGA
jgi:hypothetical protein